MGITAKELARKMHLSESAISLALNGKPGISTKTRQQILETAEKYGYDFTRISCKNVSGGTITFALFHKHGAIVADTPFFQELTEGIQNTCKEKGYKLNITYLYAAENLEAQIEDIQYSDCAGLILLGTEMSGEDLKAFCKLNVPLVLLDVYLRDAQKDCILINNIQGAFLATSYLISRCKAQPGYLHSSYPISNFEERADGFYKAVRTGGMSSSKSIVHTLCPSVEGAYADMSEILKSGETPARCYFADNDSIAIGAMKAFQKAGYRIPEDIAIVGFDNIPMCAYMEPGLTTIHVPKYYMGEMAAQRLFEILHADQFFPIKLEVGTNLVKRGSVL